MRIVLPCATIAAITSAWGLLVVSADGGAATAKELDAVVDGGDDDEYIATSRSRAPRSIRDAAEEDGGEECDHRLEQQGGMIGTNADVGVLRCGPGRTCAADVTSSVGGRCVTSSSSSSSSSSVFPIERPDAPRMAAFTSRGLHVMTQRGERALRRLQNSTEDEEFVCPTNCPQDLCDCYAQMQDDYDYAQCAPAIHSVCITGLFTECVPDYAYYNLREHPGMNYTSFFCTYAACVVDEPEGCVTPEYFKDYCQDYALEGDVDKCCCRVQALFEAGYGLYGNTTVSAAPTPPPSDPTMVSPAPMITSATTSSSVPSVAPPSSPGGGAPTVEPSDSPIIIPAEDDANVPGPPVGSPPSTASSGGRRAVHRPIATAALAASLFFGAGGAFWIFG